MCTIDQGTRSIWVDLGDKYVSYGCLNDNYEPRETQFVQTVLDKGMVAVDIGANIGWFTLKFADLVGSTGKVYAFEPRDDTFRYLNLSVSSNGFLDRVRLLNLGLSDETASSRINWAIGSDNRGGSFVQSEADGEKYSSHDIHLIRLDDLGLKRIDFLKIDVEGFEPKALSGGKKTIIREMPLILSEINFEQLHVQSGINWKEFGDVFRGFGYDCYAMVDGKGYSSVEEALNAEVDVINVAVWSSERPHRINKWEKHLHKPLW